jgi:hypothetical protein
MDGNDAGMLQPPEDADFPLEAGFVFGGREGRGGSP